VKGGGGTPSLGFSTLVHDVTDKVTVPPGFAVPPAGFREIEPGVQAGGGVTA
jgi:hypothetical protein